MQPSPRPRAGSAPGRRTFVALALGASSGVVAAENPGRAADIALPVLALPVLAFLLLASLLAVAILWRGKWRLEAAHAALAAQPDLHSELQARGERFRQLIEGAPIAMLMVDEAGTIELVNAQSEVLFGYPREELIGRSVDMLLPQQLQAGHQSLRENYHHKPDARRMGIGRELYARRKDGSEVPVEVGLSPIHTEGGLRIVSSLIDLTERRHAEARFRLAVDASPNAIVIVDTDGRIELVNSQTEALFGYTRAELIGQAVEILLPKASTAHHHALRDAYMREPNARRMGGNRELYGRHKSGREIPVEVGLAPLHTGRDLLIQAAIIDISARKLAEQKLKNQALQLEAANRYKSEFLANMSHELRTPLNSILILSEQLKANMQGNLTARQAMHADIIHRSGADLLRLINDILDLSKIEAGHMTVHVEVFPVGELVSELDALFRSQAEAKGLIFHIRAAPGAPLELHSDRQRLQQILKNLVSNAIKFTDAGAVSVEVSSDMDGAPAPLAGGAGVHFAVRDSGIGIPPDRIEQVFEAFQQLDGSTSRRFGGTGLGLTISRQLAGLLGGAITAQSEPGTGSLFSVYLPVAEQTAPLPPMPAPLASSAPVPALPGHDLTGHRVLLVDDDVRNIYAMTAILEGFGLEVASARHGGEALSRIEEDGIDIVLMDMAMPVMDGYTATRILKQERNSPIPLIAVTAHAMKGDREKCLAAGADDYLAKPISATALHEMLQHWMPRKETVQ
ncbi:PAS domain S-box protein [Niveibacterium sp. SC-1]|uniref:PAS domain-containing hybrid sensor histidine kinase/response regulator n=1 Tax=Niveibacterium sp. SC-1 TaxID=3135646 RepID=UPI003120088C